MDLTLNSKAAWVYGHKMKHSVAYKQFILTSTVDTGSKLNAWK